MAKTLQPVDSDTCLVHPYAAESQLLHALQASRRLRSRQNADNPKGCSFVSIDEVGRGCLAGPVVVCATAWQKSNTLSSKLPWVSTLKDSKKLSPKKRDELFAVMVKHLGESWLCEELPPLSGTNIAPLPRLTKPALQMPKHLYKYSHSDVCQLVSEKKLLSEHQMFSMRCATIGSASAKEIDLWGLSEALSIAAQRALSRLASHFLPEVLFFDGNRPLKLNSTWAQITQCVVTQGDDCLKTISASSVLAKVVRDRWMDEYSSSFPEFGFSSNRGYGTEPHRRLLEQAGPTAVHRHSFLKNICPAMLP